MEERKYTSAGELEQAQEVIRHATEAVRRSQARKTNNLTNHLHTGCSPEAFKIQYLVEGKLVGGHF